MSYETRFYICFLAYQRYVQVFPKLPTVLYFGVVGFSQCNWGFRFSRIWRCAISQMVSDFSKEHNTFECRSLLSLKVKALLSFEGRGSSIQRHSITSQLTGILTEALISPLPDQEGNSLQRPNSNFCKPLKKKKIINLSVQPDLRGSIDFRVGRKVATFNLFSQSSRAKDLPAPL